jgi:hypothetical protein
MVRVIAAEDQIVEAGGRASGLLDHLEQCRRQEAIAIEPQQEVADELAKPLAHDDPEIVAIVGDFLPGLVVPRRSRDSVLRGETPGDDRGGGGRSDRRENRGRGLVHRPGARQSVHDWQAPGGDSGADDMRRGRVDDDEQDFQRHGPNTSMSAANPVDGRRRDNLIAADRWWCTGSALP